MQDENEAAAVLALVGAYVACSDAEQEGFEVEDKGHVVVAVFGESVGADENAEAEWKDEVPGRIVTKIHRGRKAANLVGTRRKNMRRMRNLPVIQPVMMQATREATRPPREARLKPSPLHVLSVTVDARVKRSRT